MSNLPINVNKEPTVSTITYANEVIAIIAGMAANEVDGVASMTNTSTIADLFGRAKPVTRGVKVEVGVEEASADLMLIVEYGKPIQRVCTEVQESVRKAIETMTGLHVVRVDVHVMGVSFEREAKEIEQGYFNATTGAMREDMIGDHDAPLVQETSQAPKVEDLSAESDDSDDDYDFGINFDDADDEEDDAQIEDVLGIDSDADDASGMTDETNPVDDDQEE